MLSSESQRGCWLQEKGPFASSATQISAWQQGEGRCQNPILTMPSDSTEELSQVESEAPFREHVTYFLKHHQRLPTSALLRTPPSHMQSPPVSLSGLLCLLLIHSMTQSPMHFISHSLTQQIFLSAVPNARYFVLVSSRISSLNCHFVPLPQPLTYNTHTVLTKYWNPTYLLDPLQTSVLSFDLFWFLFSPPSPTRY